jgi:hypothetical protein
MSQSLAAILILILILFLSGCGDINWNWSDNRKRIKPGLSDDVEIDPEVWNYTFMQLYLSWRLQQDQAEIDKLYGSNLP